MSVLQQFEAVITNVKMVQDAQRPLVAEVERLRVQIAEFGEQRSALMVCLVLRSISSSSLTDMCSQDRLNQAVQKRMVEDNAIHHYQSKVEAERQKLADAEKAAEAVQEEFQARHARACKHGVDR